MPTGALEALIRSTAIPLGRGRSAAEKGGRFNLRMPNVHRTILRAADDIFPVLTKRGFYLHNRVFQSFVLAFHGEIVEGKQAETIVIRGD
jgi:hypothetical protein